MKDVAGNELEIGDYVAISANVYTSSHQILFGKVVAVRDNSVQIVRQDIYDWSSIQGNHITSTIYKSKELLRILYCVVPADIKEALDNEFDNR
jgi:hypothetical protein